MRMFGTTILPRLIAAILCVIFSGTANSESLRIITINVWSGLDYDGHVRFGEFETPERRELRFYSLLSQIRLLQPDVIYLQEANPVVSLASRLADSLGYDEIHTVCMGGIKIGPVGIPTNFKEGLVTLAQPMLNLQKIDSWKLSGSFGLFGDAVTIQFDESNFALAGKILFNKTPIFLLNVHLSSDVPMDSASLCDFNHLQFEQGEDGNDSSLTFKIWEEQSKRRKHQIEILLTRMNDLPPDIPVILGGDFNATLSAPEMMVFEDSGEYFDSYACWQPQPKDGHIILEYTWDHTINENTGFSTALKNIDGTPKDGYGKLNALYDAHPRNIDHIYFSKHFTPEDILECRIVLDSVVGGVHASDHFGVLTEIDLSKVSLMGPAESGTISLLTESTIEPFPILSYDTDAGFGYGVKAFFLNKLGFSESFDAVLFNSTKGERWYRFVFSMPDFEVRQGKIYPLAVDLTIDYDKWIQSSYFGIGSTSRFEDRESYSREPLEFSLSISRGFSPNFAGQFDFKYKVIRTFQFTQNEQPSSSSPSAARVFATSLVAGFRYDTRNSFIHPSRGVVMKGEVEFAPDWKLSNVSYIKAGVWLQHYSSLFDYPKTILAIRAGFQEIFGNSLPFEVLLPIGGGSTLRGAPQDRYLDKLSALFNTEIRFPIYGRLGGIFGYDIGKVWNEIRELNFQRWGLNPTAGLRFYFDTFVVRADLGFGRETTGFYLNFGHIY